MSTEHLHSVYDTDSHFIIYDTTKEIRAGNTSKAVLVQGDHNSERFTFELPRHIEGHDMSLCDLVEIHFCNTDSKTKKTSSGRYNVTDMEINPEDDTLVIFSWLIDIRSTRYEGQLDFLAHFACTTEVDGNTAETYAWNTKMFSGIKIEKNVLGDGAFGPTTSAALGTAILDYMILE